MQMTTAKLLLLPGLAMALVLTGCTSGGASNGAGSGASNGAGPAAQSHLTKILKSKTIKIAVETATPGWSVLTASGKYEGYDVDLANALSKSLGAKVEFVATTNENRIPLLQSDKVDATIAVLAATNVRAQLVDMSIPYAAAGTLFAVPKNSSIKSYADLAGKSVSTSRGSLGQTLLKSDFPQAKAVAFTAFADSVQALKSGKVDALIETNTILSDLVKNDPNLMILPGPLLASVLVSVGVKQGDQQWLNYINTVIRNYNISGENAAATEKWFNMPMPDFLK